MDAGDGARVDLVHASSVGRRRLETGHSVDSCKVFAQPDSPVDCASLASSWRLHLTEPFVLLAVADVPCEETAFVETARGEVTSLVACEV